MGEIKPLGSEKLAIDEKMKRIIELSNYNYNQNTITESTKVGDVDFITECKTGGFYGIVKEKNDYYVKKGLNENTLDYIGGMFMKNKNKFHSYSEAIKRLDLLKGQEELQEATKYVLKSKDPVQSDVPGPIEEPNAPAPTPSDVPLPDTDMSSDVPAEGDPTDIEVDNTAPTGESDSSKPSDYMSEIQKFSGKLGQELRDQREKMKSDDIKYVLNMVISAVNLDTLDQDDLEDIASKFDRDNEVESNSSDDDNGDDGESDLSETDDMNTMDALENFINTPLDEEDDEINSFDDISKYSDLSEEDDEEDDEDKDIEIDLDELKKEINNTIDQTLSKYFK